MTYDFFAEEWYGKCSSCGTELFAPTKSEYMMSYTIHTHSNNCLGGW